MIIHEQIMQSPNIETFIERLSSSKCQRCSLSRHDNNIVVYRGNPKGQIMLIGEAPGLVEDQQRKVMVGPAGILLDKIFASVGIDTNKDAYLSNICKCRPVAAQGSGKQNYTPLAEQRKKCVVYVQREIELINPKIIILAGLTAAKSILPETMRMKDIAGKFLQRDRLYFIMYHPAHLIHAQKSGREAILESRQTMWKHVNILRDKIDELGIQLTGTYKRLETQ